MRVGHVVRVVQQYNNDKFHVPWSATPQMEAALQGGQKTSALESWRTPTQTFKNVQNLGHPPPPPGTLQNSPKVAHLPSFQAPLFPKNPGVCWTFLHFFSKSLFKTCCNEYPIILTFFRVVFLGGRRIFLQSFQNRLAICITDAGKSVEMFLYPTDNFLQIYWRRVEIFQKILKKIFLRFFAIFRKWYTLAAQ